MTIAEETKQKDSITEGWRALELFTNRLSERRLFGRYLNEEKPPGKILFFHGEGGNGKSLLLRFLRENYCKKLSEEDWREINLICDEKEFAESYTAKAKVSLIGLPYAYLDFGSPVSEEGSLLHVYPALLKLRRQLGAWKGHKSKPIKFCRFDWAVYRLLSRTNRMPKGGFRSLFPSDEMGFAVEIAELFGESLTSFKLAIKGAAFLEKHLGFEIGTANRKRKAPKELVEEIEKCDPEIELPNLLPEVFADDLNDYLCSDGAVSRVVLFFDQYDEFQARNRSQHSIEAKSSYAFDDSWVRRLFVNLDLANGLVPVVMGKVYPHWENANDFWIPRKFVDLKHVGSFSDIDAIEYLRKAGVQEISLSESIVRYVSPEKNQVHPLYLGLCADIILKAQERGEAISQKDFDSHPDLDKKEEELFGRLLGKCSEEVANMVRCLGFARAFDQQMFSALGGELGFNATSAEFQKFIGFSFVREEKGRYFCHSLIRALLDRSDKDVLLGSNSAEHIHRILEKYFRERSASDKFALVEAIYHLNRYDGQKACDEWCDIFEKELRQGNYSVCEALCKLRNDLKVDDNLSEGSFCFFEGSLQATLSQHKRAEVSYLAAINWFERVLTLAPEDIMALNLNGNVLVRLGELQGGLGNTEDALASYRSAIESYDRAHKLVPYSFGVLNNSGIVLRRLGELQARLSQMEDAFESYKSATESFDRALNLAPDDIVIHINKGNVLQSLGELQARLSKTDNALASYKSAIDYYEKALRLAPADIVAQNSKGNVLMSLGELQAGLSNTDDALASYQSAIMSYDRALNLTSDDISILNNKGNVLVRLGELQASLRKADDALASYQNAIGSYDQAAKLAPDDVDVQNNKGNVLQSLGEFQAGLWKTDEALVSYQSAIECYDRALKLAPDYIVTLNNKGTTLRALGNLQASYCNTDDALASYQSAIECYDRTLKLAPNYIFALNNTGNVLQRLGGLQVALGNTDDAMASFQSAMEVYDRALELAPDHIIAMSNKGNVLQRRGDMLAGLSKMDDALVSYLSAIESYGQVLNIAPDDVVALYARGNVLGRLGDLQAGSSKTDDALVSYQSAIESYDRGLKLAPGDIGVLNNKGNVLKRIGELQSGLSKTDDALASYHSAIESYDQALKVAPDNNVVLNNKANVLQRLRILEAELVKVEE